MALAYGLDSNTSDIDTFDTDMGAIDRAFDQARADTGLNIEVSGAGGAVGDVPYHSGQRLIRVVPELTKLAVYALEKHDVALSKTVRGYENDLAAIEKLHQRVPLDEETLVKRYVEEMSHAIGHPKRLDQNFLLLIDRLFGEIEAERVKKKLAAR